MPNETTAIEMPERKVLLNPGPAATTDSVKLAQLVCDICPREKEFGEVMEQVAADLTKVVHGDAAGYSAVLFCGSGTVCIDASLSSFLPGEGKALIVDNGAYSSRAAEVCEFYGMPHTDLKLPIDRPVDPADVERALAADNVDACMASAQKGIQGMTGLSFIIARTELIERSAGYPKRSYYCNVYQQYDYFRKTGQMHFTPPVQTIYAAKQALAEYFEEGEQAKYERHMAMAERIHKGLERLGLKEAIDRGFQSGLVVSVVYPDDPRWSFERVHDYCYERGFTIYPGKITGTDTFRLCTLGAIYPDDIDAFFDVLEGALADLGMELPL